MLKLAKNTNLSPAKLLCTSSLVCESQEGRAVLFFFINRTEYGVKLGTHQTFVVHYINKAGVGCWMLNCIEVVTKLQFWSKNIAVTFHITLSQKDNHYRISQRCQ
jgi:hypothetical protein